jgi:hypothetical protein
MLLKFHVCRSVSDTALVLHDHLRWEIESFHFARLQWNAPLHLQRADSWAEAHQQAGGGMNHAA